MNDENWRDQYKRACRSTNLVMALAEGTGPELHPAIFNPEDAVHHACADIFHLRDWIAAEYDDTDAAIKRLDDELFKKSTALAACRDIANGSKHLKLVGRTFLPTGVHAEMAGREFRVSFAENRYQFIYRVRIDESQVEASQLLGVAMATWDMWFAGTSTIARDLRASVRSNPWQGEAWEPQPWGIIRGD